MNYNASISDFFESPKWLPNMLLGAVTILIPLVGPLVLGGWHVTGFWARGNRDDPAGFPPYDFQYFGKYLERGVWPFLVAMVASLVLIPVMMCLILPLFLFSGVMGSSHGHGSEWVFIAVFAGIVCLQVLLSLVYQLLVTPLLVRATITQDFSSAFDLRFAKSFLSLTWKEMLVSMLFMLGVALCLMVLAVVTCYIGAIVAAPVAMFGWHHLQKQLYQLYLARGGEPVPLSAKLQDGPPPLPPGIHVA
ncbi:MAG: DUF4013 domain-containing protein [Verrucomicrobiota bacterium]